MLPKERWLCPMFRTCKPLENAVNVQIQNTQTIAGNVLFKTAAFFALIVELCRSRRTGEHAWVFEKTDKKYFMRIAGAFVARAHGRFLCE